MSYLPIIKRDLGLVMRHLPLQFRTPQTWQKTESYNFQEEILLQTKIEIMCKSLNLTHQQNILISFLFCKGMIKISKWSQINKQS